VELGFIPSADGQEITKATWFVRDPAKRQTNLLTLKANNRAEVTFNGAVVAKCVRTENNAWDMPVSAPQAALAAKPATKSLDEVSILLATVPSALSVCYAQALRATDSFGPPQAKAVHACMDHIREALTRLTAAALMVRM
jgi:hypothetical protein